MATNSLTSVPIGSVAIATGIAGLLGLVFIILFFTVGKPFGTLNDYMIGVTAVMSAILVWMVFLQLPELTKPTSLTLAVVASLGSFMVVVGSVLVISRITGWYRAGLYMAAGNALIGLWLIGLSWSALGGGLLPNSLAIFGLVSGIILALGLAAIPGIFQGLDPEKYSMSITNVLWGASALGWLVLFPIWCILLGRLLLNL